MKVKDLIKELNSLDPEQEISIYIPTYVSNIAGSDNGIYRRDKYKIDFDKSLKSLTLSKESDNKIINSHNRAFTIGFNIGVE